MIGRAPIGERVRREVAPHGRNMNVIVAINQEMGLVHHQLGQFIVTRNVPKLYYGTCQSSVRAAPW